MNEPFSLAEVLMVTWVGRKVGETLKVVPTKASEVKVSVCAELTPPWNPMLLNVATPPTEVVVTEVMFVVTPSAVS
jgi:hypothetical protein